MITIQLAPPEELEDRTWYIPDLLIFLVLAAASWWTVTTYLDTISDKIASMQEEKIKLVDAEKRLSSDLERYDEMNRKIRDLENKILSLQNITVSRVSRFRPVILMEHLQNLKPEGIWFHSLSDDSRAEVLTLKAGAFDNLLVAEFMSNLGSTNLQEVDGMNIRTQIYFSQLELERVSLKDSRTNGGGSREETPDEIQSAFNAARRKNLSSEGGDVTTQTNALFPELSEFPTFEIRIKYQERTAKITTDPIIYSR